MNSKQPGEKININNIFFEDSFIDLINKLSKSIQEYYHPSMSILTKASKLVVFFENNINQIGVDNYNFDFHKEALVDYY